jgi:hypothetical protein
MNLNQPEIIQIDHVVRSVLADKPRITKFNIDWDNEVNKIPEFKNNSGNFMFSEGKMDNEKFMSLVNNKNENPFNNNDNHNY